MFDFPGFRTGFSSFSVLFIVTGVIGAAIFVFALLMIFSPRVRGKMMGRQVKAAKYMIEDTKDDLTDIAATAGGIYAESGKRILDENEDTLRETAVRTAGISAPAVEATARAVRRGLTQDDVFCKYCGAGIDVDSVFCKKCGRQQ